MHKYLPLIALIVAVAIAGCGGVLGGDTTPEPTATPTETPTATETPTPTPAQTESENVTLPESWNTPTEQETPPPLEHPDATPGPIQQTETSTPTPTATETATPTPTPTATPVPVDEIEFEIDTSTDVQQTENGSVLHIETRVTNPSNRTVLASAHPGLVELDSSHEWRLEPGEGFNAEWVHEGGSFEDVEVTVDAREPF